MSNPEQLFAISIGISWNIYFHQLTICHFFAGYLRLGNVYNPVVYGILHNPRNGDLLTRAIHQLRFVGGSALDINHGKSQENNGKYNEIYENSWRKMAG